jgi:hypothetical protein
VSASAGGEVTGVIGLTDQWAAADQASVLDGLVAQLDPDGVTLPSGTAYDRAAALLSAALVFDPSASQGGTSATEIPTSPPPDQGGDASGQPSQQALDAVLAGLQAGGFITYDSAPRLAEMAVVVAGGPPDTTDADQIATANGAWVTLAAALDDVGTAAVLAGTTSADGTDGAITALRADANANAVVSTVAAVEDWSGRVATVLALTAEAAGVTGHYGPGAPDGAIPDLTSAGG